MKVWVLGAGFSRSLGGPLLNDLLSRASLEAVRRRLPTGWPLERRCDDVVDLFLKGQEAAQWENAEEFIAALGSCDPKFERAVIELIPNRYVDWKPSPDEHNPQGGFMNTLWIAAIRMVAAQCMEFLSSSRDTPEAWIPYRRWAGSVSPDDVIVSFNYDEVVEAAFLLAKRRLHNPNVRLPAPIHLAREIPTLLKLHGGVEVRDTIENPHVDDSIANLDSNSPLIAVPGQSKADDSETDFRDLWELASDALARAEDVAIIGYGFPQSDQMAKAMILDALAINKTLSRVDLVLGPSSCGYAARTVAMLGITGVPCRETGLWGEEYLVAASAGQGHEQRWFLDEDDDDDDFEDRIQSFRRPMTDKALSNPLPQPKD